MSKSMSAEGRREACLRTTADCLADLVEQVAYCAREWPEYEADGVAYRAFVDQIVEHARRVGYVGKGRK